MTNRRHPSRDEAHPPGGASSEPDQVEYLFRQHGDAIQRYCLFELGSLADAEDAVSETFARLIRRPRRDVGAVDGDADRAWLFGIARNVIREQRRKRNRNPTQDIEKLDEVPDATALSPDDAAVRSEEFHAIRAALRELTPDQREVLTLRFIAGLSSEDAGRALGKRAGTVRVQQMRALEALRLRFAERDSG